MLRASAKQTETEVDLRAIAHDDVDPVIEWGVELRQFATALTRGDGVADARAALVAAASPEAAERAAGVIANFQMMNRILDATGCPVHARMHPMAPLLDVEWDDPSRR
ncbi:MAG: hypothetical protein ACR2H3_13335 [Acidimicrobiales bacterium]